MMTPQLHIAFIHGIGKNGPGYSKDLREGIIREFDGILRRELKTQEKYSDSLNFIEIVWDDILAQNQAKLAYIFREEFKRRRMNTHFSFLKWFGSFLVLSIVLSIVLKNPLFYALLAFPIFNHGKKLLDQLRSDFAAEYVSDIIAYREKAAYDLIHGHILAQLDSVRASGQKQLTMVTHSLGTVIGSDFIYDQQKNTGRMHPGFVLHNLFTMGSPIALFSLQYGPDLFKSPTRLESPDGIWINLLDDDDFVAYPLRDLNEAYGKAVRRDVHVETGLLGISHINYWTTVRVQNMIASKLALDWLKLNGKISDEEFRRRLSKLDGEGTE